MEIICRLTDEQKKDNVVYIHNKMLFNVQKEWEKEYCHYQMAGMEDHY